MIFERTIIYSLYTQYSLYLRMVVCIYQRVELECHDGIRGPKTIYGMVFGT